METTNIYIYVDTSCFWKKRIAKLLPQSVENRLRLVEGSIPSISSAVPVHGVRSGTPLPHAVVRGHNDVIPS